MSLIEEIMSIAISEDQIRIKRDAFMKRYGSIGEHAPETDAVDYKKTQCGLGISKNAKEEFTWADSEIDKFLPEQLRLT
jgi:hypothetical protein